MIADAGTLVVSIISNLSQSWPAIDAAGSWKTLLLGTHPTTSGTQAQNVLSHHLLRETPTILRSRDKRNRIALVHRVTRTFQPQGPGSNDRSRLERISNVLTSAPFVLVGQHTMRNRTSAKSKRFGASFMGVGLVAALYHSTSGPLRAVLRKLDYWSISLSTSFLRHSCTGPERNSLIEAGLLALTPLKPTLVTGCNMGVAEVQLGRAAWRYPQLRPVWATHVGLGAAALVCFAHEDVALDSNFPFLHAAWHCLAAGSMLTFNGLLKHAEQQCGQQCQLPKQ